MSEIHLKAETFLNAYIGAFEAFDAERIASFYNAPCVTMRGDGEVMAFATQAETSDFFAVVVPKYQHDGMTSFAFDDLEVAGLGAASARLTCRWRMLRKDGSVIRAWRQTYVITRRDDEWAILCSLMHQ
ncbi:DUF4440 domain-containing protein [Jannaschia seohaensis]|uniref:Uncharacterized protein DUF4440 n=1 Tax=Jannaschia seohaensis TaxID=475081 RepID=A0A2Y9AK11_9RHOB|nr:DUF4440 domain-containing protein [Jannaschia seohaensis]PWJ20409.1 uncharacterized protein DUF4440 [Jannaschia seohaensis]SSA44485.1 protein of unknown function [Jannaschia seohaensis]